MAAAVVALERAAHGTKSRAVLEFLAGAPKQLLINGKWVPAKSGKTFATVNPARTAFESGKWSNMSPHQRARAVFKIADIIAAHGEELAELITLENGKP